MLSELIVGPPQQSVAGGVHKALRGDNTGGLCTQDAHARYYEAVYRGNVFGGSNSAAITFGTTITLTGVTYHLFNPWNSGRNLVILRCSVTILTATTSGSILYVANINPIAALPGTTTAETITNCLLGSGNTPTAQLFSVATLPAVPKILRPLAGAIQTGAANSPSVVIDNVDGEFVVGPGCILSVQGKTIAGTGIIGMTWEEVPV